MDVNEKGLISENIDSVIEQKNLVDKASWAVEAVKMQYAVESTEKLDKMLTLAYVFGSMLSGVVTDVLHERYVLKVDKWLYKRWVKDFGKEEADKMLAEKLVRESKEEDKTKPLKIEFTEEDYVYIREKLASVAQQFKLKINQEYALKKAHK